MSQILSNTGKNTARFRSEASDAYDNIYGFGAVPVVNSGNSETGVDKIAELLVEKAISDAIKEAAEKVAVKKAQSPSKTVKDKAVKDKAVKEKTVKDKTVKDKTVSPNKAVKVSIKKIDTHDTKRVRTKPQPLTQPVDSPAVDSPAVDSPARKGAASPFLEARKKSMFLNAGKLALIAAQMATDPDLKRSRDMPDTKFYRVFHKPCMHNYGRANTDPTFGGAVWGGYMLSYNVGPQTLPNYPPTKQVARSAEFKYNAVMNDPDIKGASILSKRDVVSIPFNPMFNPVIIEDTDIANATGKTDKTAHTKVCPATRLCYVLCAMCCVLCAVCYV